LGLRSTYQNDLHQRYWNYKDLRFSNNEDYFEHLKGLYSRPPVFTRKESWRNVLVNSVYSQEEINRLISLLPKGEKHKWFRSMNSSQALSLSVFGNLKNNNQLHHLKDLKDDDGELLFENSNCSSDSLSIEYRVDYLGEPRPTSLDVFISDGYKIAIECKFTEWEIGTCSRPKLTRSKSNYEINYCNGIYSIQRNRNKRCSLSEIGVKYWEYIPEIFQWSNNQDLDPCPVNNNYQLIRNILASCVKENGTLSINCGHTVLIYDERNPAFQPGGKGFISYTNTKYCLNNPRLLRKCSWQRIFQAMRHKSILPWLLYELKLKYGF